MAIFYFKAFSRLHFQLMAVWGLCEPCTFKQTNKEVKLQPESLPGRWRGAVTPGHRATSRGQLLIWTCAVTPGHRATSRGQLLIWTCAVTPGDWATSRGQLLIWTCAVTPGHRATSRVNYWYEDHLLSLVDVFANVGHSCSTAQTLSQRPSGNINEIQTLLWWKYKHIIKCQCLINKLLTQW